VSINDVRYTNESTHDGKDGKAEQASQLELALDAHLTGDNDGDREKYEKEVGDNIRGAHRDELCETLPALWSWIWNDLPIICDGSAFSQVGDDDSDE
jgi:hypothetical protein